MHQRDSYGAVEHRHTAAQSMCITTCADVTEDYTAMQSYVDLRRSMASLDGMACRVDLKLWDASLSKVLSTTDYAAVSWKYSIPATCLYHLRLRSLSSTLPSRPSSWDGLHPVYRWCFYRQQVCAVEASRTSRGPRRFETTSNCRSVHRQAVWRACGADVLLTELPHACSTTWAFV